MMTSSNITVGEFNDDYNVVVGYGDYDDNREPTFFPAKREDTLLTAVKNGFDQCIIGKTIADIKLEVQGELAFFKFE